MKILITERQLKRIKGEMKEALGVPEGILDAGEEIYDLILQELNEFNGDIDELNKDGFEIDKEFTVGGHTFNKIRVKFDIEEHPMVKNADMVGMSSENESELDDRLVFRSTRDPQEVVIGFRFFIGRGKGIDVIKNYLKKHRNEDIPSLSHEIKHAFIDVKQKTEPMSKRVGYGVIQQHKELFGFITELNDFLYNSYFIHAIENVVRPTELAAEMRINNVSRKEFLKFFLNSEMIKKLKEIQNFSYEDLNQKLHSSENIGKIKEMMDAIGIDYKGEEDDEVVDKFLKMFVVSLTNKKNELMNRFLTSNAMDVILGLRGVKDKFFRKYVTQTTKYGYDYDAFFENEENNFHRVSTMMIKKLAKLYAMAKNNPPE
jgi:hypothetical protein